VVIFSISVLDLTKPFQTFYERRQFCKILFEEKKRFFIIMKITASNAFENL